MKDRQVINAKYIGSVSQADRPTPSWAPHTQESSLIAALRLYLPIRVTVGYYANENGSPGRVPRHNNKCFKRACDASQIIN